ncbi:MAG: hypothetical protein JRC77_01240 [Deltaproteobacteria bacterium]|nr:hypothetical protein [Deltaproteobacteria bacterium]
MTSRKLSASLGPVFLLALLGCNQPTEPIARSLPEKVYLPDSTCPIIHCNTYQTDALPLAGPEVPGHRLTDEEKDHLWSSPIAGGILDFTYPDGQRIFWVPQVDRIMKLRLNEKNELEKINELPLEPKKFPRRSPEDMQRIIGELDATEVGTEEYDELADAWHGYQLEGLRAYYAMLNNVGILYVGNRNSIIAYGDMEAGNPESGIVKLGQYGFKKQNLQLNLDMPLVLMIGMNMTPDGHLIAVTIDGTLIGIKPDLSAGVYYKLPGQQIWNSVAIDDNGGIYVAGSEKLHKLIWTGSDFSDRPEDGAWVESYAIGSLDDELRGSRGTGTTPALMGQPSDKDRFVVIADAENVNNLMFYWRDEIPADWEGLPGASSRRLAGLLPVDFGDSELTNSYSENSATIFEYGAVLANNQVKTHEQMMMDVQLKMSDPARTPMGVQKFDWDPEARKMKVAWVRADVSSPNSTPVVAMENRQLHVVGLQEGEWVMETLDWDSGETRARYILGSSERYNPIMLALQILPNGDPLFATFGGVMHLKLGRPQSE